MISSALIYGAQGVVIEPGVIFHPTESKFYLLWNFQYEDNKAIVVDSTYVKIGGIKIYCYSQILIKIVVNGWYPENKNKAGKTVFDLEFYPDKAGVFTVKFEGLTPGMEYTILKNREKFAVIKANDKGVIFFSSKISEPTSFVIKCGGEGGERGGEEPGGTLPIPAETPPTPFINPVEVIAIITALAALIGKKRTL